MTVPDYVDAIPEYDDPSYYTPADPTRRKKAHLRSLRFLCYDAERVRAYIKWYFLQVPDLGFSEDYQLSPEEGALAQAWDKLWRESTRGITLPAVDRLFCHLGMMPCTVALGPPDYFASRTGAVRFREEGALAAA